MKHPKVLGLYYKREIADWVEENYTVWPIADWRSTFGQQCLEYKNSQWTDHEGRLWEFFGWTIPLFADGERI